MERNHVKKGRGAITNVDYRFADRKVELDEDIAAETPAAATQVQCERAKTIITRNTSPDVPFTQSVNPYRGCEHGCSYCYARASHAYLQLSPGLDFETKIFAKINAPELLSKELAAKSYVCETIALGNNTDAFQPVERKMGITRRILEIFAHTLHPVSIVTKSALILRDLDLLVALARNNLVHVCISVTTLDHSLAAKMEPRAAAPSRRLQLLERLSSAGVPVSVLIAPIIPAINDNEVEMLVETVAQRGATRVNYVMLRLPHEVEEVFQDWLRAFFPLRYGKVMNKLKSMFGGNVYQPGFGTRMRGTGEYASLIRTRFDIARRKAGLDNAFIELRTDLFRPHLLQANQLNLF